MEWYHKVFNYLSKHITKAHRDPLARSRTSKAIPKTICDMAYSDIIFNGLQNEIAHSVLQLVERRRIGQEINTDTLKSAINVFKDENIYEEMLEASIISYSKKDFHSKGMSWIATDSTPEFLLKVDQQIEEVKSSVRLYLPPSTEPKMLHALNSEILAPYTNILSDKDTGCLYLLNRDCYDDLRRMFRLFSKVGADHLISESFRGFLASLVEAHVKTFKEEITSSAGTSGSSSSGVKDLKEKEVQAGMKLVPALIELLEKYSKMVKETFDGTASFQKALKDAFSVALRSNGNSQAILNALVTFCDTILKKQIGGSEENQSESQLDFAVSLLAFMEDKDYFVEVYRTHLSKRYDLIDFISCCLKILTFSLSMQIISW